MSFINKITPPFLRELDAYLRVNHSWIWATKIHLHLYLGLLLGLLFSLIGLVYFVDINAVPSTNEVNGFFYLLFVPAALFTLMMLYNMSLFNTDKSAGYRFRYQEFFQFIIYFISFCLPLIIIVPPVLILNERIDRLVDDEQFELDKKYFNEGDLFFPRFNSYEYHYYPSDKIYLEETTFSKSNEASEYEDEIAISDERKDSIESAIRKEWNELEDSIFWHKGVFQHSRPKLYFEKSRMWGRDDYYDPFDSGVNNLEETVLKDSLFKQYLNNVNITRDPQIAAKNIPAVSKLLKRYYKDTFIDEKLILNDFIHKNYGEDGFNKEFLQRAFETSHENVNNIQNAKLKHIDAWKPWLYNFLGIFIFALAILFYIFKNVHWRQFLLAAAVGALLMTLISVIETIFRFHGQFIHIMAIILTVFFLMISVNGFHIRKFSWILNQINIMLNISLPFLPVIILGYMSEFHGIFTGGYFDQFKEYYINERGEKDWRYNEEYHILVDRIWKLTFWSGILSYLFIWNSYLKILYLRYWFLPKTK